MNEFQSVGISIQEFLPNLSIGALGINWLDIVIIIVFLFYAYEGFIVGFVSALFDLVSFVLSFLIALKFYSFLGGLLYSYFSIPQGFANAFGFFIAAFISEVILNIVFRNLFLKLRKMLRESEVFKSEEHSVQRAYLDGFNRFMGIIPGLCSAFILLAFLLTLIISLPFSPFLKQAVSSSRFGNMLVSQTQGFEKSMNSVFGGAVNETLNFLTVKPQSDELVQLNFSTQNSTVDETAEEEMIVLVNKEREKEGLPPLTYDSSLRAVARLHSEDMFSRGYFSHYTPDGLSPFDRMAIANISYTSAGENLALAPNTELAMQGLMQSPGHKANILAPQFGKIGIGVMDGGIYGKMYTQTFSN